MPDTETMRRAVRATIIVGACIPGLLGVAHAAPPDNPARALARARPGEVVTLGARTYVLNRPLEVPRGVTLAGAKSGRTTLRINTERIANFAYGFAVRPRGNAADVTVKDLTIDGGLRAGETLPENHGGGLKSGNRWTITNVTFTNINYFELWLYEISGAVVTGNTFTADPGVVGRNDNIGGGRSANLVINDNLFTPAATGSAIDLLRSRRIRIRNNAIDGTADAERSLFLEGVTDSVVSGNTISHGAITAKTDRGYSAYGDLTNPANIRISGNTISDSPEAGIAVVYSSAKRGQSAGGGNVVVGNTITRSGRDGIVMLHCAQTALASDRIARNVISDAFTTADYWSTGCGIVGPSGIAVTGGSGTVVRDNAVLDASQRLLAAVWFGADRSPVPPADGTESGTVTSPGLPPTHYVR